MNTYTWDDIHLGLEHSFTASFAKHMVEDFAALSGDHNPLHTDAAYAAAHGFVAPVLFGLMVSSLYSRLVGMYLPGRRALLQGIDIDFNAPAFAGEMLSVEGKVTHLNEAYRQFEVKSRIRKEDRTLVSKATIRVGFHGQ